MQKIEYPGVAQLVAHVIWVHGAERSNRSTRTKGPLEFSLQRTFVLSTEAKGLEFDISIFFIMAHKGEQMSCQLYILFHILKHKRHVSFSKSNSMFDKIFFVQYYYSKFTEKEDCRLCVVMFQKFLTSIH